MIGYAALKVWGLHSFTFKEASLSVLLKVHRAVGPRSDFVRMACGVCGSLVGEAGDHDDALPMAASVEM